MIYMYHALKVYRCDLQVLVGLETNTFLGVFVDAPHDRESDGDGGAGAGR